MKAPRLIDNQRRRRNGERLATVKQHEFMNTYTGAYEVPA
jgi:hypothetical protein